MQSELEVQRNVDAFESDLAKRAYTGCPVSCSHEEVPVTRGKESPKLLLDAEEP
jgi:hypothetical protein